MAAHGVPSPVPSLFIDMAIHENMVCLFECGLRFLLNWASVGERFLPIDLQIRFLFIRKNPIKEICLLENFSPFGTIGFRVCPAMVGLVIPLVSPSLPTLGWCRLGVLVLAKLFLMRNKCIHANLTHHLHFIEIRDLPIFSGSLLDDVVGIVDRRGNRGLFVPLRVCAFGWHPKFYHVPNVPIPWRSFLGLGALTLALALALGLGALGLGALGLGFLGVGVFGVGVPGVGVPDLIVWQVSGLVVVVDNLLGLSASSLNILSDSILKLVIIHFLNKWSY